MMPTECRIATMISRRWRCMRCVYRSSKRLNKLIHRRHRQRIPMAIVGTSRKAPMPMSGFSPGCDVIRWSLPPDPGATRGLITIGGTAMLVCFGDRFFHPDAITSIVPAIRLVPDPLRPWSKVPDEVPTIRVTTIERKAQGIVSVSVSYDYDLGSPEAEQVLAWARSQSWRRGSRKK